MESKTFNSSLPTRLPNDDESPPPPSSTVDTVEIVDPTTPVDIDDEEDVNPVEIGATTIGLVGLFPSGFNKCPPPTAEELSRTLDTGLEVDVDVDAAAAANARKSSSRRSLVPQADWRKRPFPEPPGDEEDAAAA
jgi:hypothetical protein